MSELSLEDMQPIVVDLALEISAKIGEFPVADSTKFSLLGYAAIQIISNLVTHFPPGQAETIRKDMSNAILAITLNKQEKPKLTADKEKKWVN